MDNIKYNLFFTSTSSSTITKVRRGVWFINLAALGFMLIGMVLVLYLSPRLAGSYQVGCVVLGFLTIFVGSHILWAGLASLRGLEERLEGVEEG